MRTTRLHVTLHDVEPPVVRVVDVPAASTLAEVHQLSQSAIGWTDSHLHEFSTDTVRYGPPDADLGVLDGAVVRLPVLPERFRYLYDYGDGWAHDVRRVGPGGDRAGCVYGEGACPPEDCGGPPGYAELLATLAGTAHPDHVEMSTWAGPRREFDQAATDLLVTRTAGGIPAGVRSLLDLTRDGVKLTPGGRLPRAVVRAMQAQRPDWAWCERPARVEDDLIPLRALHDLLRECGLLRLRSGVLGPTRAAADDLQVVRRLRAWFARDAFTEVLVDLAVAVIVSEGPSSTGEVAARVLTMLGPSWSVDGRPITAEHVARCLSRLHSMLRGLDLIEADPNSGVLHPGRSARCILPRVTRLAHIWENLAATR